MEFYEVIGKTFLSFPFLCDAGVNGHEETLIISAEKSQPHSKANTGKTQGL